MKTIKIPENVYERILKALQSGVDVCYNVDYSDGGQYGEKSPSYATGYSRSAMQEVIEELKNLKSIKG